MSHSKLIQQAIAGDIVLDQEATACLLDKLSTTIVPALLGAPIRGCCGNLNTRVYAALGRVRSSLNRLNFQAVENLPIVFTPSYMHTFTNTYITNTHSLKTVNFSVLFVQTGKKPQTDNKTNKQGNKSQQLRNKEIFKKVILFTDKLF